MQHLQWRKEIGLGITQKERGGFGGFLSWVTPRIP